MNDAALSAVFVMACIRAHGAMLTNVAAQMMHGEHTIRAMVVYVQLHKHYDEQGAYGEVSHTPP
ncbi:MAG: hypothetical protein OHK0046_42150 [Anaerolineae bacterium]